MLVEFGDCIINTDHIVCMELAEGGHATRWTVTLTFGKSFVITSEATQIERLLGIIVAAQPGYSVIEVFIPKAGASDQTVVYRESTILAFRVVPGTEAPTPITADGGIHSNGDMILVRDPGGRCVCDDASWDTLDAFKAETERKTHSQFVQATPPETQTGSAQPVGLTLKLDPTAPGLSAKRDVETDPVLAVRIQILGEPIRAVGSMAFWRPELAVVDVINAVRQAYPDLHTNGVGYNPKWGWKWGPGDREKSRDEMTTGGNVQAFEASLQFLSYAGRKFLQRHVSQTHTSYSWKHSVERVMGVYVPNGMLIAAAYALGFKAKVEGESPNVFINLSGKAFALDPGKGMS